MARDDSPLIYGDFWLDKRRDGKAPTIWQIAWYEQGSRQVRYRSTRRADVNEAAAILRAHEEQQRAKGRQSPEDALVIPLLFLYWKEKGSKADSQQQIASSLRQFIGFLMQDEATTDLTVAGINHGVWERFREWRMSPHEYDVPWFGKDYRHLSRGVSGEAVSRNLDDIRAALNHQVDRNRLPYMPKVPDVPEEHRSPARDLVLTTDQLGSIIGYAAYHIEHLRWVLAMIATAARPDALLALDPHRQSRQFGFKLVDIHPPSWPRTKKVNPVIPVIPEFEPWLRAWAEHPHPPVASRKIWWRHMRRELGLPEKAVPKTIRHTIATRLRSEGVPGDKLQMLLGHETLKRTTRVYAKYDPQYLQEVKAPLSMIWSECCTAAHQWLAVHLLSTPKRGQKLTVLENGGNLRK